MGLCTKETGRQAPSLVFRFQLANPGITQTSSQESEATAFARIVVPQLSPMRPVSGWRSEGVGDAPLQGGCLEAFGMRSHFRYAPGRAFGTPEFAEVRTPIDPRGAFVDQPPNIIWADTEISESF